MPKYDLILGGLEDQSPEALRRLKGILVGDLELSADKVKRLLTQVPCSIKRSEHERELEPLLRSLRNSGALAYIDEQREDCPELSLDAFTRADGSSLRPVQLGTEGWGQIKHADVSSASDRQESEAESAVVEDESFEFEIDLGEISPRRDKPRIYKLSDSDQSSNSGLIAEDEVDHLIAEMHNPRRASDALHVSTPAALSFDELQQRLQQTEQVREESDSLPALTLESPAEESFEDGSQALASALDIGLQIDELPVVENAIEGRQREEPAQVRTRPVEPVAIRSAEQLQNKNVRTSRPMRELQNVGGPGAEKLVSKEVLLYTLIGTVALLVGNFLYFSQSHKERGDDESLKLYVAKLMSAIESQGGETIIPAQEEIPLVERHFSGMQERGGTTVEIEAAALGERFETLLVKIYTPEPPELTWEEIANKREKPPWAHTILIENLEMKYGSEGKFLAVGNAKVYVDYLKRRERFVTEVKVKGTFVGAEIRGDVVFGEGTAPEGKVEVVPTGDSFLLNARLPFEASAQDDASSE